MPAPKIAPTPAPLELATPAATLEPLTTAGALSAIVTETAASPLTAQISLATTKLPEPVVAETAAENPMTKLIAAAVSHAKKSNDA